ncbi:MAG: autotransporter domain-containing protein [Phycisphaerales bacterium JB043]
MKTSLNRRVITLSAGALIAAAGQAVQAQETWVGGGTSNTSDDANWLDGTAPVGGVVGGQLTFDTSGADFTPFVDSSLTGISSILFDNSGGGAYVIDGNAGSSLTFTGAASIVNQSSSTQTINVDLVSGGSGLQFDASNADLIIGGDVDNGGNNITNIGSNTTTINGVISGTGGVQQTGSGTLTLGGSNTYTGATTVTNGTLNVTGTLGGDTDITVSGGGSMTVQGSGVISGNGTITVANAGASFTTNAGSSITGNGDITLTDGTMTINGSVDGGNNIDVNGGTFTLGSSGEISAGGTLDVTAGTANVNGDITGDTNIDVSGGTLDFGSTSEISGNGTFTQSGGTTNLGGDVTGNGSFTLNGGTFTIESGGGTSGDNAFTINTGATLVINAGGTVSTGADFNFADGTFTNNGSVTTTGGTTTIAGTSDGSGTFNVNGSGVTFNLTGTGDFGGSQTLNLIDGTYTIDGIYSSTGNITMTDGTLTVSGTADIGNAGASNPDITINGGMADFQTGSTISSTGTVTVNNDATVTFDGSIGGDLNINGNGVSTADNGDATVDIGANAVITGNLNNYSTNLTGTGNVQGNFTNWADGSFDAAGSGTIGTFDVDGDLVVNANSDLTFDINIDAGDVITNDQIIVGGDVQFGAPGATITVNDLGGTGTWEVGDTITIIDGEGSGTVTDNGVTVVDTFDFLDFTININGSDVELIIAAASNFSDAATPTFQSMGMAMDTDALSASGDYLTFLTALNALATDAEKAAAIQASSPLNTVSIGDASLAMTQRQATVNTDYLYARRNGFPSPSGYAQGQTPQADMRFASLAMDTDMMAAAIRNAQPGRLGRQTTTPRQPTGISTVPKRSTMQAYGNFFTLFSDQDTRNGFAGYSADAFGGQFGVDTEISPDLLIGLMVGVSNTKIDYATGGDADVDTFRIGPYVSWEPQDNLYVDASLTYGTHSHDSDRMVSFMGFSGLATSSFDADDFSAGVKIGYEVQTADFNYMPFVSLNFTRYESDAYTETGGGGASLSVASRDLDSLEGQIGIRLSSIYQRTGAATIIPEGYIAWGDEFMDPESIEATFTGGSTQFTTNPADPNESILFGVGASMLINSGMSAFIRYDGETNDDGDVHAISGGVNIRF